jgi:zinc finger FYVE domain-containing protein 26
MIKYLLHNAKVKLLQNSSSNYISLCDTYLSLIDVLEKLLLANCSLVPSLHELRNTESCRRIRNRLLEEERHELAMDLSTKCGLDTQTVWASWGLIELRRGNYAEARDKFAKCLKPVADKNSSQGQFQILNDVIGYLENAAPIRMQGPQTLLAPLRSVESLLVEPKLYFNGENMMDDMQLNESIFYLETYGNHALMTAFYQRHGYLTRALGYILDSVSTN